jgi:neutral ceramidase
MTTRTKKSAAIQVGAAQADITSFEPGTEMLGWANSKNIADAVSIPLEARAFVLVSPADNQALVLVSVEICFATQSVRDFVLQRLCDELPELGANDANFFLSATHTHSGPGGYQFDLLYTLPTPGYRSRVFDEIVDGIVSAVRIAWSRRRSATLHLARSPVPLSEPVAFNRSIEAYNRNADIETVATEDSRHVATNRDMTVLLAKGVDGVPIGVWSFFAVHCTSVHADNRQIHPDNKGHAADELEAWARIRYDAPEFVAAFAQGAAGDVSPNFRWSEDRGIRIGAFDDDDASAKFNGSIQAEHARRLCEQAERAPAVSTGFDSITTWLDFAGAPVDADYADGVEGRRTGWARMGLPFMIGTAEGPGPLRPIRGLTNVLSRGVQLHKTIKHKLGFKADADLDSHGPMYPFLEVGLGGRGTAFGLFNMGRPVLPDWVDPGVAQVRQISNQGFMGDRPWVPNVLPVQLLRIGHLAIAGLPAEPTTQAGRRIERDLLQALHAVGVTQVVVAGYANGYSAYVTTREEYLLQDYEGGATLYGQWTLGAYRTRFREMAAILSVPRRERAYHPGPRPPLADPAEMEARRVENLKLPRNWIR